MIIPQTEIIALLDGVELFRAVLPPGEFVIGREVDMQIRLNSDRVSRRHAQLTLSYFDWMIEDFGSANGTFVSGEKIAPDTAIPIFPQQEVAVGNVRLELRRLRLSDVAGESLAPQTAAVLRYLPADLRGDRKYHVKGLIATGGMGVILEAEDVATRRHVAMKVLMEAKTPEHIARFIEEAQITAQLEHPNIVPIYELNVNEQDKPFYVMKLVRGESLKQVVQGLRSERPAAQERYPLSELLTIFLKVCDAIAFAHSKGVVHRDLKPDNIMVGEFGETLVMDWGLAKPLGESASKYAKDASIRTFVTSLRKDDPRGIETELGVALGTPQFMSPEQAAGRSHTVDARSDVYALGAILYNLLTLQPPVEGADAQETLDRVVSGSITPPQQAVAGRTLPHLPELRLPEPLIRIALKAMSLEPADRYATVRELQTKVRAFQFGEKKHAGIFGVEGFFRGRNAKE